MTGSTAKLPAAPAGSHWRPNGGNTATIDDQGNITGLTANGTYSFLLVTSGTTCGAATTLSEKTYTSYLAAAYGGDFAVVGNPVPGQGFPITSFGTLADAGANADPSLYGTGSPNTLIFQMANRTIHYANAANNYVSGTTYQMTVNYNPVTDLLTYTINNQTLSFHPKAINPDWATGKFMSVTMLYLSSAAAGQKIDVTNIKLNGNLIANNSLSAEGSELALNIKGYDYYNGYNVTADVKYTFASPPAPGALFFDYKFGQTNGCTDGDNGCVDEVIVTKTAPPCSVAVTATPGSCVPATNQYTVSGVISLTSAVAGTATVTDGTNTTTVAVTTGTTSVNYSFNGLTSDGATHTVTASLPNCGSATTTYTAPTSCSVAPPCGLAMVVTPGPCASATNDYVLSGTVTASNVPTAGTLTISSGAFSSRTISLPAGNATGTFSYSGLVSNGQTYTVTASYSDAACSPVSQVYTAPASCSITPVCSLNATATPGACAIATNTYSVSVVVNMSNAVAGTLTVSLPGVTPITQAIAANTSSFTAVFAGLPSDGASHVATVSLPGCGSTTASFTAPSSCSVAPVCSINAVATAGPCQAATNTYSSTVVVTVNNPTPGTLSITDGAQTLTFSTTANAQNTFTAVFNGLASDGTNHSVTASLPGCSTATTAYTAPVSCSVTPVCSISATATAGPCQAATNTYSSTVVVTVQNPAAGTITIADGAQTQTSSTTAGTQNTFTVVFPGLTSNGANHTVTATLPGCSASTTTYTAPASCSVAPNCSLSVTASGSNCNPATNLYVLSGVITLTNSPSSQTLTLTDGSYVRSLTANAGTTTINFSYTTLQSDGAVHTVTVTSNAGACGTASTTYTAPASCSTAPVCSISAVATPGLCASATNTFSNTVTVTMNNPVAGTLTVTDGVRSVTFAVPASTGTTTANAVFNGMSADGTAHTVTISLPGCSTTSTTYTAPTSCAGTPVCSVLGVTATPTACVPASNQYTVSGIVSLTNAVAGTMTISIGASSTTVAVAANTTSVNYTFSGLTSDGAMHSVVASLPGCGSTTTTYTAPASCSVASIFDLALRKTLATGQSASVTPGSSVTFTITVFNQGNVAATNIQVSDYIPTGLTLNDPNWSASGNVATLNAFIASLAAGASTTRNIVFTVGATATGSLTNVAEISSASGGTDIDSNPDNNPNNDGTIKNDVIDENGKTGGDEDDSDLEPITVTPTSVCSLAATATPTACVPATNTYSVNGTVTLVNPVAGTMTISMGSSTTTVTVVATTTSVNYSFTGLISDGAAHPVTASLPGCSSTTTMYTAPGSCTQPAGTKLTIDKRVNKSKAKIGDVLTYTIVLTNTGTTTASNVVVRDSSTTGLAYVANSATAPAGTTFTQETPISTWRVASITAGQSLSLTFQAIAESSGILYNVASIPGDTAKVCTSIPVSMCPGDEYTLTVPAGRSGYRWYKNGVLIQNQTSNVLTVTEPGSYSLGIDNAGSSCPDFSCCPFILELDSLPAYQAVAVASTCQGNSPQNNGQLVLSHFNPMHTYQYSTGTSFNPSASLSGAARTIPANGVIATGLANPASAQAYTVRVYNSSGCYTDMTVMLMPTPCGCPAEVCAPYVVKQIKRPKRIGDPR